MGHQYSELSGQLTLDRSPCVDTEKGQSRWMTHAIFPLSQANDTNIFWESSVEIYFW